MAESKTYAISTVTRGMCLETRPNSSLSTGVYDRTGKNQAQLWAMEQSDDAKSVAFRSIANRQYLRAAGKGDGAKAQTGAKSWWTLEPGDAPGLWWIKCKDTGNYLNNYGGGQRPNNTVQMWISNLKGWNYALQWYIHPTKPSDTFSFSEGTDSADSTKQKEELEAKSKALEEREQELASREKEVTEKENALEKQEADMETREKALTERETINQKQDQDVEAREKALAKRQQKLEDREKAVIDKKTSGDETGSDTNQVAELQCQLGNAQQELADTKAALRRQNKPATSTPAPVSGESSEEVAKLRKRIAELEAQVKDPPSSATTTPLTNGQQETNGLRPIIIQKEFGFLPRLTDPGTRRPSPVLPLATSVG